MKVIFHESIGGISYLEKIAKTKEDKVELFLLIKKLIEDTSLTLACCTIKKIQGTKMKIFEIIKKDYRIFYIIRDDNFIVLDITLKKKIKLKKRYR